LTTPLSPGVEVMRKDAVFAVLLNVALFRGMSCSIAQERYLRFSVLTPSGTIHYNLRVCFLFSLRLSWAQANPGWQRFLFVSLLGLGGKCTSSRRSPESDQRQYPSCINQHVIIILYLHALLCYRERSIYHDKCNGIAILPFRSTCPHVCRQEPWESVQMIE